MPVIQNENRLASIPISTASGKFTIVSASTIRDPSPQTLHGSLYIPASVIDSSGVASNKTSLLSDTSISSSTTNSLPVSAIFVIVFCATVLVAALLCFTFWFCRRSPPTSPSVKTPHYLRKRRPPRSMSNAMSTKGPVIRPDRVDGLMATLHPPNEKSPPAATNAMSQRGPSGFRIPRKAPPRLPSWALSSPPEISEMRSPEPLRLIPDPVLVRAAPQARIREISPTPDPLASTNLMG